MHYGQFNSKTDDGLISIEELRDLRVRKQKIERDKKAREYISEINLRCREMRGKKSNNFFNEYVPI